MAVFEHKTSNKVTLDDTVALTCIIESAINTKDHTQYILKVQRGPSPDNTWQVSKRYSDFNSLDAILKPAGVNFTLPPKRVFGKMDREFVAERQKGLQNYLNQVLNNHQLSSLHLVKAFLDPANYSVNLQEKAFQQISMHFRSDVNWEVAEPLPGIGWRIRKEFFMIRNKHQMNDKFLINWNPFGPDMFLDEKDLEYILKILPTFQHPYLLPISFAKATESSGLTIRPFHSNGTLRDQLCKVLKVSSSFIRKYVAPKSSQGFPRNEVRLFGRQILEALKSLHDKNIPYGHLHAGNVIIDLETCQAKLLDLENGILGLPSFYRPFFVQFRKISSLEAVDVYCFGQLLYEMSFGEPLGMPSCDTFPPSCPSDLCAILHSILSSEACKDGLPSVSDLLNDPFFRELSVAPVAKPQMKIPSKLKDALKELKSKMEKRLKEEQKSLHQFQRRSRAQAFHMSDDEKRKRKLLRQSESSNSLSLDQPPSNGHSSSPSPQPVMEQPPGRLLLTVSSLLPDALPPPPPPPPPPPQSPQVEAPTSGPPGRTALLSSIQGFSKGGLKKAVTVDKSAPKV
ncbi:hypothetical protein CAPTEDRAFT_145165 [Capitella teleta]|uniref:PX domain-containing protein n=1 Tax=Capitella teleta TaxID=283909 RepID=R7T7N7_CAPTE|nr:hypothetical protein CAPTEDRAFT_145165 [Capitella teleta]|eukprot:ELT89664.1 hypothetical protein CAPTEDRAFT_145165 [Capitella teleta]